MATIYMCLYGREGLKELAKQNLAKAAYAREAFGKKAKVLFDGAPRFNEFVIQGGEDPAALRDRLLQKQIIGGLPIAKYYPELKNASLWCATEMVSRTTIDAAAAEVKS
jgi:glycine dehydrogenase subunit 1